MKHLMTSASILALTLCANRASATAPRFTFNLPAYPVAADACNDVALALGQRFTAATGVPLVSAICKTAQDGRADLQFTYEANAPVPLLSTAVTSPVVGDRGGYASAATCAAALPTETAVFTDHTGHKPVFAYCYPDVWAASAPWVLRLDAFGGAPIQPYFANVYLFGGPVDQNGDAFRAHLIQALGEHGLDTRFVEIRGKGGYSELTLLYYGPDQIQLESQTYAQFQTKDQCTAQLVGLHEVLAAAGSFPLLTYCAQLFTGRFETQTVTLGTAIRPSRAVESFATYDLCAAARAGLIQKYQDHLGRPVLGGVCTLTDQGNWTVALIERRSH